MQRPQSEGRVSSPPRRQRHTNCHRKTSVLSKSYGLFSESSSPSGGEDHQHTTSLGEPRIKDGDHYERPPRRPKTTPKPRIERLLVGPGKAHIQEAHSSSSSAAPSGLTLFFMTHLPDSPPRPKRSSAVSFPTGSSSDDEKDDDDEEGTHKKKRLSPLSREQREAELLHGAAVASNELSDNDDEDYQETGGDELTQQRPPLISEKPKCLLVATSQSTLLEISSNSHVEREEGVKESDTEALSDCSGPTAAVSAAAVVEKEEAAGNCERGVAEPAKVDGPLQIDILLSSFEAAAAPANSSPTSPQLDTSDEEESDEEDDDEEAQERADTKVSASGSDQLAHTKASETISTKSISVGDGGLEGDDEYSHLLVTRQRMAQEEQHREQLRSELESYVALLTSHKGEDGAQLVEFPRNYQQVLSLMSEHDVRDEDPASSSGGASGNGGQRSWSHVLIQAGLSKQQAFGALNDEDEASGGGGGMATKIALKMARVRQLDVVLEKKLGKNLYASSSSSSTATNSTKQQVAKKIKLGKTDPGGKAKPIKDVALSNNNQQSASNGEDSLAPLSITTSAGAAAGSGTNAKGGNNFIERNRKVIAHGMKAVLSNDEESRLSRLLRDLSDDNATEASESGTAGNHVVPAPSGIEIEPLGRNEYEMDANDKKQIEELLIAKQGVYQTSLLPPEDYDAPGDGGDNKDNSESLPSSSTTTSKSKSAFNIIQATKKERLCKQRLERIEQEIQFLKENESMSIVADDDDNDDNDSAFNDDTFSDVASTVDGKTMTMSERSFRTTASSIANSVCSTRSGVISRRQFNQFLALEKQQFKAETKASADDIRRLVASLSHLRTTTPTTSRPVA